MNETAYANDEEKWQAERDLRTLVESMEIRNDPERLKRAMKCAREQKANLTKAMTEAKDA